MPPLASPSASNRACGRARPRWVLLVLAAAIGCIGCGSTSSNTTRTTTTTAGTTPAATTTATAAPATSGTTPSPLVGPAVHGALRLAANPSGELRYSTTLLKARAGPVRIDFTNLSPLPHNVTVATLNGKVLGAVPTFRGGSRLLTLHLKPGRYVFYCSVPGHRAAGMQGTLLVK